jgi:NADPH:quinone reductase-like Zn-dependent oxidoreductase
MITSERLRAAQVVQRHFCRHDKSDIAFYKEILDPEPNAGYVIIDIKAFGLNHAEMHVRRGEWAEAAKVIGIECVGLVKSYPVGKFPIGAKVAALIGSVGPTIDGSYAEYTCAANEFTRFASSNMLRESRTAKAG